MIDLNAEELKPISIFNDGKAGLVKGVTISVTTKQPGDPNNRPDYNLVITDSSGATLREGFYNYSPNTMKTEAENTATLNRYIKRLGTIIRAAMGDSFVYPELKTAEQAYKDLFAIIAEGTAGKKFNVFVTYGTKTFINKNGYLKLRFFDFIEPGEVEYSNLKVKNNDLMERIVPDADAGPSMTTTPNTTNTGSVGTVQSWTS